MTAATRKASERDNEIVATAVWLYKAAVSGICSRDLREGLMNREESDAWAKNAIKAFEDGLRDLTKVPAP